MTELCSDKDIETVMAAAAEDSETAFETIDNFLTDHQNDPRLHFMKGSILIEQGEFIRAHNALERAVELAPDFAIARFQLGLFQLTSGEANAALSTWGPLDRLPDGHYLRQFVDGLRHMIRDEFQEAIAAFNAGIAANQENLPLNNDMQKLAEECARHGLSSGEGDVSSETALLLSQKTRFSRH